MLTKTIALEAIGIVHNGTEDVTHMDMSWDWTVGAMISTLDDLRLWQIQYGLGIYYEFAFLGHDGADIGYQSDMMYYPEKEATIVILFNKLSEDMSDLNATEKAFVGIADIFLPGSIPGWYKEAFEE